METYQLKQIQNGQFLKIVDGEITGEATPGEVLCHALQKQFSGVDVGLLEVFLALAAVTGFLCTLSQSPVVKVFSLAAFFLSVIGAYNLTWLYVQPRIPITWTKYLTSPIKQRHPHFPFPLWLPGYFLQTTFRLSFSLFGDVEALALELCYLMLFTAAGWSGLALSVYVLVEAYKAII